MIAIQTKYISPTNTRGARIKAFTLNPEQSLVMPYPDGEPEAAHRVVAQALADKYEWGGKLAAGCTKDGFVFVFVFPPEVQEDVEQQRGEKLVKLLQLKQARDDDGKRYTPARYATEWGSKTAIGLFRTIKRLITEDN